MKFIDTFDTHKKNPNISFDEYSTKTRLQLCGEISNRLKLYLDTKYWIYIRDAALERSSNEIFKNILNSLRALVKQKIAICPISDEIFYELLLQTDAVTLNQTVELIDELSEGVAILSSDERVMFETLYFLNNAPNGKNTTKSPNAKVWSKVAYVLGLTCPSNKVWGKDELIIQKAFFDQMWSASLMEVTNTIGIENIRNWPRHKDISTRLTKEKIQHANENKSFQQIYLSEFAGVLDAYRTLILEGVEYFYTQQTGKTVSQDEKETSGAHKIVNAIYNLFRLGKLGNFFPSFVVESGLHASVRNDLPRKYKTNDLSDFRHARAALPYFDAFFTEKSLKNLVCTSNIRFDKKYDCEVFYKPSEVLTYIEKIKVNKTLQAVPES